MSRSFQAIVVGAGPAGSSAALALASAGIDVALIERGNFPGEKNMFGGLLHRLVSLEKYILDFWEVAPVERYVMKKTLSFLTDQDGCTMEFECGDFDKPPFNGFTVFRPRFDRWLAEQAEKAGATLINRCTVDDIVREKGKVSGVSIVGREGVLRAPVIIAADGVLSFLAGKAGLRQPTFHPDHMALGVKALFDLPKEVIDDRFGLLGRQGLAGEFVGCSGPVRGGGCLYTNMDTVSVGLVVHLGSLMQTNHTPYELLNNFLRHPKLEKFLKGATLQEYSAHVIPEGGFQMVPELVGDGILVAGDAAAFCNVTGLNLEGINLASHSGILAAETVVQAISDNEYGKANLQLYKEKLEESFVLRDLKKNKIAPKMLHNQRIYVDYPEAVCKMMESIYRIDGQPRDRVAG
ncbi:MAG: FAD-dependent oxidoreductase, partial [Desulforhopalus sp.]